MTATRLFVFFALAAIVGALTLSAQAGLDDPLVSIEPEDISDHLDEIDIPPEADFGTPTAEIESLGAPDEAIEEERNMNVVLTPVEEAPTFVVFIPEQIDTIWYWYYYTEERQSIVQSAVEKALVRAGYDIIDLSIAFAFRETGSLSDNTSQAGALRMARELGATYAIVGRASAVQSSRNVAYGVNVVRSGADASAKLVRVADGKVMAVEDAAGQSGGQAQKAAAQGALREVGQRLAKQLLRAVSMAVQP